MKATKSEGTRGRKIVFRARARARARSRKQDSVVNVPEPVPVPETNFSFLSRINMIKSCYMKYPLQVIKLIEVLKKLPGVGNKSAERFAFQMIQWKKSELASMAETISATADKLRLCSTCGCLADETLCHFCDESRAASGTICVIASLRDAFIIEDTKEFRGFYHVIGGLLSPIDGLGPERLGIEKLRNRIISLKIREVVIALDSTLEGDATSLFLKNALGDLPVKISRLAFGMPLGSSLDYVDGGTLARAFSARSIY